MTQASSSTTSSKPKNFGFKNLIWFIVVLTLVVVILGALQKLVMPKYMGVSKEGTLIEEYYRENKDFDVIFVGDCEVYENFVPAVLWEEHGINSYIRGSAQQLIWHSYYLMEETLKYEHPDVFVFNVLSMKYDEPQSEAYNRMTLDGMRWSPAKIKSIRASMTDKESFIEYVFPILRYHSRLSELEKDDFTYYFHKNQVGDNGYFMQLGVVPADYVPESRPLGDYTFGDTSYEYLDRMTKLCKDNDIELILIKAPSLYPTWFDEWDAQMEEYASENDLKYINFLEYTDEIGLDFTVDTYDAGLHLNLSGAKKLTSYFGDWLTDNVELKDRRNEEALVNEWDKKLKLYYDKQIPKGEQNE